MQLETIAFVCFLGLSNNSDENIFSLLAELLKTESITDKIPWELSKAMRINITRKITNTRSLAVSERIIQIYIWVVKKAAN